MAKGRMISKAISLDEKVNALSDDTARLLFTWLITHLDCEGWMHGDAITVKSIVFPRRNISTKKVEKYLKELENCGEKSGKSGLITRYFVNGNQYLCMKNFEKHQTGLRKDKELQSQIPPFTPDQGRSEVGNGLTQDKVKDKVKEEVKDSSFSKEDVFEIYKRELAGMHEEEAISEYMEGEIEGAINIFSAAWVVDAIREAVKQNKRTWVYVVGILKNWKRYGKNVGQRKDKISQDPDKYVKGKYGHMTQR